MLDREFVIGQASKTMRSIRALEEKFLDIPIKTERDKEEYKLAIEFDSYLAQFAKAVMENELMHARSKGKTGWQSCPIEYLKRCLHDSQVAGDYAAVMNYAAMIVAIENGE